MEKQKIKIKKLERENRKVLVEQERRRTKLRNDVMLFRKYQERYKKTQQIWEKVKKAFYETMEEANVIDESFPFLVDGVENEKFGVVSVKRVQKKHITFDIEKLEKSLNKKYCKQIVQKRYIVNDIVGLVSYLKKCDVSPAVFKKYLDIEKSVDTTILDNLYDTGEIKGEDIKDCYEVKEDKPYWLVKETQGCEKK